MLMKTLRHGKANTHPPNPLGTKGKSQKPQHNTNVFRAKALYSVEDWYSEPLLGLLDAFKIARSARTVGNRLSWRLTPLTLPGAGRAGASLSCSTKQAIG